MRHHNVDFHLYADDTQLYITFESSSADLAKLGEGGAGGGGNRWWKKKRIVKSTRVNLILFYKAMK